MKKHEVQELGHGLYRIYWDSGGSSLASVGSKSNGDRWLCPTNWTSEEGRGTDSSTSWDAVKKVTLIASSKDIYVDPDMEYHAEEYECAMMHLSDLDIAEDDGYENGYSLVGRIDIAILTAKLDMAILTLKTLGNNEPRIKTILDDIIEVYNSQHNKFWVSDAIEIINRSEDDK